MGFHFGDFELDRQGQRLLRAGVEVRLERRAFDMLCYLAERPGQLVTKDELLQQVWQARSLSDGVLSNTVAKLRRALGQTARDSAPIETVHGRGYRFASLADAPGGPAEPATAGAGTGAGVPGGEAFVGRQAALALLDAQLQRAAGGQVSLVCIGGEPGIGKTYTARELSRRAASRGFRVLQGSAHEGGMAPAYWPWIEVLRQADALLGAGQLAAHLPADARALPRLCPELWPERAASEGAAPADEDTQAARFRLFDELSRLLASLAAEVPCMVVLDDLHWADSGSIELLAHVARAVRQRPLLLLATLRDVADGRHEEAQAGMRRLSRLATHVRLEAFSSAEVAALTAALRGGEGDTALAEALHARSGGNPFFVRQLLELVAQRGEAPAAEILHASQAPPAVRDLLEQRLQSLSGRTRALLAVGSLLGDAVDAALLGELCDASTAEVVDDLQSALDLDVLQADVSDPYRYHFAHTLMRDTLREGISLADRGRWHGRIAAALCARPAGTDPRALAEVAHHHLLALPAQPEPIASHCRRAAQAAREAGGFEAAAELLTRAIDVLGRSGGRAEVRCELLMLAGVDRFCVGHLQTAWELLHRAADLAATLERADLIAEAGFRLADCVQLGIGDEAVVMALLDRAREGMEVGGHTLDGALGAQLLSHRAELAHDLPRAQRLSWLAQADDIARALGDPDVTLELAHTRAILRDPTALQDNLTAADAFLDLMAAHPKAASGLRYRGLRRFDACLTKYVASLSLCDLDAADASLLECERTAAHAQMPALDLVVTMMRAGRALGDGSLDALDVLVRRLGDAAADAGILQLAWQSYVIDLFEARDQLGELSAFEIGHDDSMRSVSARQRVGALMKASRFYARTGRQAQARELVAQIPPAVRARMPVLYGDLGMLCALADTARLLDDRALAGALYAQLSPHAARNAVHPAFDYRGAVAQTLGELARYLGEQGQARAHFEQALQIHRRLRMPRMIARSEQALAPG